MEPGDRLPLVKNALRLLVDQLQPNETVGIVTCASGSGIRARADENR
jgi:Ca-activated chloride channel family protein